MNKIEQMIAELCPDGVEFKKLGEIADYVRGVTYSKANESRNNDGYKVLRANNITVTSNKLNFEDVKVISKAVKVKETQKLKKDDILICAASGSKEHVGKVAYIVEDIDYYFGGFMAVIRTNSALSSRFLFHLLIGESFTRYLESALNTTTINNLNSSILNNFPIPIPPSKIQQEIVNILDKFTELEAELETELEARRKQYEFYRSKLLTFSDTNRGGGYKWVTINEICVGVISGKNKERNENGIYPIYGSTGIIGKTNHMTFDVEQVLIARVGANAGYVHIGKGKYDVSDNTLIVRIKDDMCMKYLYHVLVKMNLNQFAKGGGQPLITASQIKSLKIPIPPLEEQNRIVAILDKFEKLVNDISEGLPAEIKARRQQYEYYRNKLLTFKQAA